MVIITITVIISTPVVMLWDQSFGGQSNKHIGTRKTPCKPPARHGTMQCLLVTGANLSCKCWQQHCRPLKLDIKICHQQLNLKLQRCWPAVFINTSICKVQHAEQVSTHYVSPCGMQNKVPCLGNSHRHVSPNLRAARMHCSLCRPYPACRGPKYSRSSPCILPNFSIHHFV